MHSRLCRALGFLNLLVQVGPGLKGSGCPVSARAAHTHQGLSPFQEERLKEISSESNTAGVQAL